MRTIQPALLIILFMGVSILLMASYHLTVMGVSEESLGKSSIKVDSFPVGVAVSTATNKVYVTNHLSNTLSIIDGENNDDVKDINVGSSPYGVAVNEITNRVYVSNLLSNSMSVIDGSTLSLISNISGLKGPAGVAVDPARDIIFVANLFSTTVTQIDGISNTIEKTIDVGDNPYGVAVDPLKQKVYVTNNQNNSVSVVDYSKKEPSKQNITLDPNPGAIAIDPLEGMVYVAHREANLISVINTSTMASLPVGAIIHPTGIAVNTNNHLVYIAGDGWVSVLDPLSTPHKKIGVSNKIGFGSETPIFEQEPTIKKILQDKIPLVRTNWPTAPNSVAIDPIKNLIYVTHPLENSVKIINGATNSSVVGVVFDIDPPNSGDIDCIEGKIVEKHYARYSTEKDLECTAVPDSGYRFNSWLGTESLLLDHRPVTKSPFIPDLIGSLITQTPSNSTYNPKINMKVFNYGTLTASFRETPITDYLGIFVIPAMLVIVPTVLTWLYTRKRKSYLLLYIKEIEDAYILSKQNKSEAAKQFDLIKRNITDQFNKGKISETYYEMLDEKITKYMEDFQT